jgi:hypothetical protein
MTSIRIIFPILLLIASISSCCSAVPSDMALLTDDITSICPWGFGDRGIPGVPGPMDVLNDNAVPIVTGDEDTTPRNAIVGVASESGSGRIVGLGHDGFFINGATNLYSNRQFGINIIDWLQSSQGTRKILVTTGHGEPWVGGGDNDEFYTYLRSCGYEITISSESISKSLLSDISILFISCPNPSISNSEIDAIRSFVSNGGGLLMQGLGWSWVAYQKTPLEENPVNKIGMPYGMKWIDGYIGDQTNNNKGCPIFHTFPLGNKETQPKTNDYPEGPLRITKIKNDYRNIEIWIENPAPYFTYIPTTVEGKPNIVIKGPGIQDVSIGLKKVGLYDTVSEIQNAYQIYDKVKYAKTVITLFTNPPGSLTELVGVTLEITAPIITDKDTSLEGNLLGLLKESLDVDQNAYYVFISWFLMAKDPMYGVIDQYYKDKNLWYNGESHYGFSLAETIESDNLLSKNTPGGADDLYWPRGWESYKKTYLPENVEGYALAPNMALVIQLELTQETSPPASTLPRELELKIQKYQSLGTIEAESERPTSESLKKDLTVYLPELTGGSVWGDEKDMIETLSCIYNGNYLGSKYSPEFRPEATRPYDGTTFNTYSFKTKQKLP